jgi:hypothetical protein
MGEKRWFWATLTLSCITIVTVVFAAWELLEYRFFRDANYLTLHYLYITRGIGSSLLLAFGQLGSCCANAGKAKRKLRPVERTIPRLARGFSGRRHSL